MIKYVITNRSKHQLNRKQKNVTDSDFSYDWSTFCNTPSVFGCGKWAQESAGLDYYNTLAEAQQYIADQQAQGEHEYNCVRYGYRIWKVELLDEHKQDIAYQAHTDKVTV